MTSDQTTATPPPRGYPPLGELRRSRTDRKILGVAGGLGRYAGVDPLILRILFVVLAVFGGSGLLLYALGWLLMPDDGEPESAGQRMMRGRMGGSGTAKVVVTVVAVAVGLLVLGSTIDTGPAMGGAGVLIVLAVVVVLLARNGPGATLTPPAAQGYEPYGPVPPPAPGAYGQTPGTAYVASEPVEPPLAPPVTVTAPLPPPPVPPRERSVLGRITVSTALLVVGLMVSWNLVSSGQDDDFRAVSISATALAIVALGLVVGAFAGRARGLIALGILLVPVTAVIAAADEGIDGGVGDRTWRPTTVTSAERVYRLGVGDAELDLTALPAGSKVSIDARVGIGHLAVVAPDDARVEVATHVGAGTLRLLDEQTKDGTDLDDSVILTPGDDDTGTEITIDAEVGLGDLEVRR